MVFALAATLSYIFGRKTRAPRQTSAEQSCLSPPSPPLVLWNSLWRLLTAAPDAETILKPSEIGLNGPRRS